MVNNHYSYETKLEAILLLNEGMSGRKICKKICLKSDGLIYTWRKWLRDGQYYRHLKSINDAPSISEIESQIHQLCIETHFLYGYRKIHALLVREMNFGVSKVQRIMSKHGWSCRIKIKKFNKPGNPYKTFANIINRDWHTDSPLTKLTTDITYLPFGRKILYL